MRCKTILVHVDAGAHAGARIDLAARLARRHEAHLIGIALTGVSRLFYEDGGAALVRSALAPRLAALYRQCEHALEAFTRRAAAAGVASAETRLVDDESGAGLVQSATFADLVVLGQRDPALPAPPAGDLVPHVLLAGARPLLAVPCSPLASAACERVLIAWNGSCEAARAVTAALPLLRMAASVTIATLDRTGSPAEGLALAAYLARHGVQAALVTEGAAADTGARLLALAAEHGSDLLVMGGYGHARLHEFLLGGVTRAVLGAMAMPVLLAH